jgi:hypothetical protein
VLRKGDKTPVPARPRLSGRLPGLAATLRDEAIAADAEGRGDVAVALGHAVSALNSGDPDRAIGHLNDAIVLAVQHNDSSRAGALRGLLDKVRQAAITPPDPSTVARDVTGRAAPVVAKLLGGRGHQGGTARSPCSTMTPSPTSTRTSAGTGGSTPAQPADHPAADRGGDGPH